MASGSSIESGLSDASIRPMECAQSVGIDLPLKVLVWEDAQGQVWLGYNDPAYIAQRHGVAQCPAVGALTKALSGLAEAATAR